uniref:Uncharacterized protein n=1 Tax=Neobodo designis TaxID=312471 RepID=A0A7S1Q523_NEODS
MAVSHYRRPTPRQPESRASVPVESVRDDRAEYTMEMLSQYRRYVATSLEPELETLREEVAELRYDAELAREEATTYRHRAEAAENELARVNETLQKSLAAADTRVQTATEHHNEHIAAVRRAAESEIDAMRLRVRDAERVAEELRCAGNDPTVLKRLAAAEDAREAAEESKRSMQRRLDDLEKRAQAAESANAATSRMLRNVGDLLSDLTGIAREAADFSTSVASAFAHIECSCPELSSAASQWSSITSADLTSHPESTVDADRARRLTGSVRSALQQQHAAVAGALRSLVIKHTEALESAASSDHDRQHERELARRRLAELEEDLRAEREAMLQALERERVNARLASSGPPRARMEEPTPVRDSAKPSVSQCCQTGPELMSTQGDHDQAARLLDEVVSLQSQLAHHRETIQLLEQQRKLFMDFVDDEWVTAHVQTALNGSVQSETFMLHGVL